MEEQDLSAHVGSIDPQFWHGRRVLVTGHTGFKGGWLSLWLSKLGAEVTGFALDPITDPSFFDLVGLDRHLTSKIGDLRDQAAVTAVVTESSPEVVFHLAAQSLVFEARKDPVGCFATNVLGTVHLLEALRTIPSVKAVVAATTDKVYDNREWPWGYREIDPLGGDEPYGASKAACEFAISAYQKCFFSDPTERTEPIGLASVRAGNIIGGGDWALYRLVPDAIRAFSKGQPLELRQPSATRPWQHVLEPVRGYLMLAERLFENPSVWSEAWNFGPEPRDNRPVGWLADRLVTLWNESGAAPVAWQPATNASPKEARLLSVDNTKAKAQLGWQPTWDLEQAMAQSLEWYLAWLRGDDMLSLSSGQITAYQDHIEKVF